MHKSETQKKIPKFRKFKQCLCPYKVQVRTFGPIGAAPASGQSLDSSAVLDRSAMIVWGWGVVYTHLRKCLRTARASVECHLCSPVGCSILAKDGVISIVFFQNFAEAPLVLWSSDVYWGVWQQMC